MKRLCALVCALVLPAVLLLGVGCSSSSYEAPESVLQQEMTIAGAADGAALDDTAVPADTAESAPGTKMKSNSQATTDYSNTEAGYVMVRYEGATDKALRAVVVNPDGAQKTYELTAGQWTPLPLDAGDGLYEVGIYQQTEGATYKQVLAQSLNVTLSATES